MWHPQKQLVIQNLKDPEFGPQILAFDEFKFVCFVTSCIHEATIHFVAQNL